MLLRSAATTRLVLGLLWALSAASGCRDTGSSTTTIVHVGAAPDAGPSLAGRQRVQIGNQSRYVLGNHPVVPLRVREDFKIPAELPDGRVVIEATLPTGLLDAGAIRVDAWMATRPAGVPTNLNAAREGRRVTIDTPPVVHVRTPATPLPATLRMQIPVAPELAGTIGQVTMVARRLPDAPLEKFPTRDVDVPAGSRLRFGIAVEPPGWATGWPPVQFRLFAETAAGERIGPLFERALDPAADPRDRRWWDATVGLEAVAGRRVHFVFETEAVGAAAGATIDRSFATVSVPMLYHPGRPAADPTRNVILVSLDTLRAIELGTYGQLRPLTPNIDRRVASAGTVMSTAITPAPYTPPAHMSMLSGLVPCRHRVLGVHTKLAPDQITLMERLRLAGYHTAAFTEDAYLIAASGFERGFDTYVENRSDEAASPGFAVETFDDASRWIAANDAEPFFLFVHTYQVHEPYVPPRAYQSLFTENAGNPNVNLQALDNYDREVRYTDDLFARFLDSIDAAGIADRTILIITSDHGEGFGEHFWTGHGRDVHDEAIHVPLMFRSPGLIPVGKRVPELVGLIDLPPTILDLLHLAPLDGIDGRSFANLIGGKGPAFAERPLTSFGFGDEAGITVVGGIRTRTNKFIRFLNPPVTRFYDLATDPVERVELPSDADPIAAELRRQLEEATAVCERDHKPGLPAERAIELPDWFANREQIDEAMQKLKSLGYVQ